MKRILPKRGRGRPTRAERLMRYILDPILHKTLCPVRIKIKKRNRLSSAFLKLGIKGINYGLDSWVCYPEKMPVLYRIWLEMKFVCYNKYHPYYDVIGRRKIIVCNDWVYDYGRFYAWALSSGYYKSSRVLCRRDIYQDYSPENCYWGSRYRVMPVIYKGYTIQKWCLEHREISEVAIKDRLNRGWTVADAFTSERKKGRRSMPDPKEILFAETLDAMSKRIQKLEEALGKVCQVWIPQLVASIKEIKDEVSGDGQRQPPPSRRETSYSSWYEIHRRKLDMGLNDREISRQLGIPYATVRKYTTWSPAQVDMKRKREFGGQEVSLEMLEMERKVFGR